jgi:putative modified peptide
MAEEERQRIEILMEITPQDALDFLNKLATDDEFRARLKEDPRSVLVEYRIEINDAGVPTNAELPPKEDVQHLLDQIGELDEYGRASFVPLGYGWMVIVLGFAMPLVAGDSPEADASG